MDEDNSLLIYYKLSKLLGIKFKVQFINSEIVFKDLYSAKSLISGDDFYILLLEGVTIKFNSKEAFLSVFIDYLDKKWDEIDKQYKELVNFEKQSLIYDEVQVFYEHERLGDIGSKYLKLKSKLENLLSKE